MDQHLPTDDQPQPRTRRTYEPPRAEFVPLRVEERLMQCHKYVPVVQVPGSTTGCWQILMS